MYFVGLSGPVSPRLPIVNSPQLHSKFPEKIKAPDERLSKIETKLMRVLTWNANISMYEIKLIIDKTDNKPKKKLKEQKQKQKNKHRETHNN